MAAKVRIAFTCAKVDSSSSNAWRLCVLDKRGAEVPAERVFGVLRSNTHHAADAFCSALLDPALPRAVHMRVGPYSACTFSSAAFEVLLTDAPDAVDEEDAGEHAASLYDEFAKGADVATEFLQSKTIVWPTPRPDRCGSYAHLLAFVRNAPRSQCLGFVQRVAEIYHDQLSDAHLVGVEYPLVAESVAHSGYTCLEISRKTLC